MFGPEDRERFKREALASSDKTGRKKEIKTERKKEINATQDGTYEFTVNENQHIRLHLLKGDRVHIRYTEDRHIKLHLQKRNGLKEDRPVEIQLRKGDRVNTLYGQE